MYRALDVKLDREVALKVLAPKLVTDPERKHRFVQEARAASKLEHPHIAVIHEIDEVDGVSFIAMERIRGDALHVVAARGRLSLTQVLELTSEVAEGLARAHDAGIVHRDVKPGNIMVTEDGHAKIIDFGLAKLIESNPAVASQAETAQKVETKDGAILGTVSYMSPEQARGEDVDHRSDVFSFGIVLHELLTGRLPFLGPSVPETLNAIIHAPAPSVAGTLAEHVAPGLQRIVTKCLEKDPADRYQTMKDVVVDLRAVRRSSDSGATAPPPPVRRRSWLVPALFGAFAVVLLLGWLLLRSPDATSVTREDTSVAVMLFDNINQDPALNWMRLGLAEMLVTDLSQSASLKVVPMGHVYQVLDDIERVDERVTSPDTIDQVLRRVGAGTVLVGNFMQAGDRIRIQLRVQNVGSGDVVASESVEVRDESQIFAMVDDLSRRIQASFGPETSAVTRSIEELTTTSVEAFRLYSEGMDLYRRGARTEGIRKIGASIEIDPNFAEALAFLSLYYYETGLDNERGRDYAERAMQNIDNLPSRVRYRVEGRYYSFREETMGQAIEAYRNLMTLDPANHLLGNRYRQMERYDECIEILEGVRERASRTPNHPSYNPRSTHNILSWCYRAKADYLEAERVLNDGLELVKSPRDSQFSRSLAQRLMVDQGRLDEADATSERPWDVRLVLALLRDRYDDAEAMIATPSEVEPLALHWLSWHQRALVALHRGKSAEALEHLDRSIAVFGKPDRLGGYSHNAASRIYLETGRATEAFERAELAQAAGSGDPPEWEGLFLASLAKAHLGDLDEARVIADKLEERTRPIPSDKERRRHLHLLGSLNLHEGNHDAAIRSLEEARSMLFPHAAGILPFVTSAEGRAGSPPHVPILYALASAYLETGDNEQARETFQRIVDTRIERLAYPIDYVRSLYFLGQLHERRGDEEGASDYYGRFLAHWGDGDLDRERVDEARAKLQAIK